MKKLLLIFTLIFSGLIFATEPQAPQGTGTKDDPYQIATYENLLWIGTTADDDIYVYAVLTADIDASKSIDEDKGLDLWFYGSLDGQNHTIYDLTDYYSEEYDGEVYEELCGVFDFYGELANINFEGKKQKCAFSYYFGGTAKNVKVTNGSFITCDGDGEMYYGTIENVEVSGGVLVDGAECCTFRNIRITDGCLAYYMEECIARDVELNSSVFVHEVEYSFIERVVSHNSPLFISWADDTAICEVSIDGEMKSGDPLYEEYSFIGGCVRYSDCCLIQNVAVNVNIIRPEGSEDEWENMGGILGYDDDSIILDSYFIGTIEGTTEYGVGGIVGNDDGYTRVVNCYFDAAKAPTNGFGTAVSDADLKKKDTFENWDFENIWTISDGNGYPQLRFIGPDGSDALVFDGLSKAGLSVKGTLSDDALKLIQETSEVCLCFTGIGTEITSRQELTESKNQKFGYKSKEEGIDISYTGKSKSLKYSSTSPKVTLGIKTGDAFAPCELSNTKMKVSTTVKLIKDMSDSLKGAKVSLVDQEAVENALGGTAVKLETKGKNLAYKGSEFGVNFSVKINTAKKTVRIKYSSENAIQPAVWPEVENK